MRAVGAMSRQRLTGPFPENEQFADFFKNVRVTKNPSKNTRVHKVLVDVSPPVDMWITAPESGLSLEAVKSKLQRHLEVNESPATDDVAFAALAILAERLPRGQRTVREANELVAEFVDGEQRVAVILKVSGDANKSTAAVGNMTVGPFGSSEMLALAKKGRSSWPIDLSSFDGNEAMCATVPVRVLYMDHKVPASPTRTRPLADDYFAAVFGWAVTRAWAEIDRRTALADALSAFSLDLEQIVNQRAELFQCVGLCTWHDKSARMLSWAHLQEVSHLQLEKPDFGSWDKAVRWISTADLGADDGLPAGPLAALLQSCCRLLVTARRHADHGAIGEAVMTTAIALEMLVSEMGSVSKSFSTRLAVLSHGLNETNFEELCRANDQLYTARSHYVHQGTDPSVSTLRSLDETAQVAIFCAARASKLGSITDHAEWLRLLDAASANLRADLPVNDSHWRRLGVSREEFAARPEFEARIEPS